MVENVARTGLLATARYLGYDLADVVDRAQRLGADAAAITSAQLASKEVGSLATQLGQPDEPFDAEAVQDALTRIEADLEALRATVHAATVDDHRRRGFEAQLLLALSRERPAYGRTNGGRIEYPLNPEDLDWVTAKYHRRVWSRQRHLIIDGQITALPDHQVLALYVTRTSRTPGIVFGISVHLCERDPASKEPASLAAEPGDLFAPLNWGPWYDYKRVTCCVLHVPRFEPRPDKPAAPPKKK